MKELTLEKAYELAVKKWELIIANDGEEPKKYPQELYELRFNCSYCELYFESFNCVGCPLNLEKKMRGMFGMCIRAEHPYKEWSDNQTKANAQAVLDLIIKTKPV